MGWYITQTTRVIRRRKIFLSLRFGISYRKWTGDFTEACIPNCGISDSYSKTSHITHAHKAHEITAFTSLKQLPYQKGFINAW